MPKGASTIEQQFVRTVTAQYQKTLSRKIIEQLLSFSLYGFYSKSNISASYLYSLLCY
ncbi:transglycosylase domain-containing protein [Photobacterium kishitanii]|uniref:transglycosylase domain-containing protein n=1 Tax=Photobacterium kishitanii TaxID=318456 RepID=UPI0034E95643